MPHFQRLLTRGLTLYFRVLEFKPRQAGFWLVRKLAFNWLETKLRLVIVAESTWRTLKYFSIALSFVDTLINTTIYILNMADPTVIECSKCHIYKPHFNFVKDSPLKKLLKLC